MKQDEKKFELKKKAEQIVNFTPQEIENIQADEIQRIFYDMQVYQIELEMQNDELEKTQRDLQMSRNRYHQLYHQIPIGIVAIDQNGFVEESNHFFCQMLNIQQSDLKKKHFTAFILEEDKNQWINRFDAFFKMPEQKSMQLRLQAHQKAPIYVKLMGARDKEIEFEAIEGVTEPPKLIITVTDVGDIDASQK